MKDTEVKLKEEEGGVSSREGQGMRKGREAGRTGRQGAALEGVT
jgi:hypothetical protein